MKHNVFFIIVLLFISFYGCAKRDKITYNIPANYPEERRKQLLDICNKGKELYKAHCSDCHGIFSSGKDGVPNFSNTQIDNYSARFMRRDPKNHAVMQNMSPEQLNQVLTFLRFKRTPGSDTVTARRRL